MNMMKKTVTMAGVFAMTAVIGYAASTAIGGNTDSRQKSSEATVATNENGTVLRSFTETTVSTNGGMVTEHRRETRTTLDRDGNLLATTTSEYAQSYPAGDDRIRSLSTAPSINGAKEKQAVENDSFLGLKFGSEFKTDDAVADEDDETLVRTKFTPKKPLAGFDDFYVYLTPKTHRVVKICACAKEIVGSGAGRGNYLIEALERKYSTWARPRSWCRPIYTFDLGDGRYVTASLAGTSRDYETVLVAWDEELLSAAAEEYEELREAARKQAVEKWRTRVDETVNAF